MWFPYPTDLLRAASLPIVLTQTPVRECSLYNAHQANRRHYTPKNAQNRQMKRKKRKDFRNNSYFAGKS